MIPQDEAQSSKDDGDGDGVWRSGAQRDAGFVAVNGPTSDVALDDGQRQREWTPGAFLVDGTSRPSSILAGEGEIRVEREEEAIMSEWFSQAADDAAGVGLQSKSQEHDMMNLMSLEAGNGGEQNWW